MSIGKLLRSSLFSSILTIVVKILAGGFGYWMFIVFAKEMNVDEYGQFTILFSIIMFIGYVSNFGQQTLIVKELPNLLEKKMHQEQFALRHFVGCVNFIGIVTGSLTFIMISLIYWGEVSVMIAIPAIVIICAFSATQSTLGLLRVYGKTVRGIFTRDLLWRIATIGLFIFGIHSLNLIDGSRWSVLSWSVFCIAVTIVPVLSYQIYLIRNRHKTLSSHEGLRIDSAWKSASVGFTASVFIANADSYIYTILVGKMLSPFDTGLFFSSLKTVEIVSVFLVSVALVFAPKFSLSIKNGDRKSLQRKCNLALLIQGIPAMGCLTLMVAFAPDVLVLFNEEYHNQSYVLICLAVGMAINALSGPTGILLQLAGLHWKYVKYQSISIGLALALMPLVTENFGIYGVCILFLCSKLLWNLLSRRKIKATLGVEPSVFAFFSSRYANFYELKEDILELR